MEKFIKENWFRIVIALAVILMSSSIAFYYLSYIPKRDAFERGVNIIRDQRLTDCLAESEKEFNTVLDWGTNDPHDKNGNPVTFDVESLREQLQQEKSDCLKRYPPH